MSDLTPKVKGQKKSILASGWDNTFGKFLH